MPEDACKIAIVTGAGSGIGRAVSVQLGAAGYCVVLVSRSRDKLLETAEQVKGDTFVYPADISDAKAVGMLIEDVSASFGRVDALVHNAGFAELQAIDQITSDSWRKTVDVNLSAAVLLSAAVWPIFKKQQSGTIVNVSSMATIDPFPGLSAYAAAKIGVNLFTQCTANEGEPFGVRAVAIAPGAVETPMLRANFDESVIPAENALSPDAVAEVIVGCITGDRDFTNGETIVVPSP